MKVQSKRLIYTPNKFAKESLIYLQEVGTSKTLSLNKNTRTKLNSYLFFIVLEGDGTLIYKDNEYKLSENSCVFIDCKYKHSHISDNFKIAWIHFCGLQMEDIYNKYLERNGKFVFKTSSINEYSKIIDNIMDIANGESFIKDMEIYSNIAQLLTKIMKETIYNDDSKKKYNLEDIRKYLDENYTNEITLDSLSNTFYINKFYLTRAFKDKYGTTINNYLLDKRIMKAKELLRYSNNSIDDIAKLCGIKDQNYFSRLFKKVEGTSPIKYRKMW